MKLTKDDPKLTAYALGELSPRESHEVAKALEAQPELASEVDDIRAFEALFGENDKLTPQQRAAIFQFGSEPDNVVNIPQKSWKFGVVAILGAAAAVIITLTMLQSPQSSQPSAVAAVDWSGWSDSEILSRVSSNTTAWNGDNSMGITKGNRTSQALQVHASSFRKEMKSRAEQSIAPAQLSAPSPDKDWIDPSATPVTRVPLVAGNASFEWVSKSIESGKLPSASSIREEELLNVSVPKLQADLMVGGVAGSVEFVQSPWNADELLAFVRIAGDNGAYAQAAVKFSEAVKSYRLIGYTDANGSNIAPAEQQMNHSHLAVYEMQLKGELNNSTEILKLDLQVRSGEESESDTLHVLYNAPAWQQLNHAGLKHSVLVATWIKWLKRPTDLKLKEAVQSQLEKNHVNEGERRRENNVLRRSLDLAI